MNPKTKAAIEIEMSKCKEPGYDLRSALERVAFVASGEEKSIIRNELVANGLEGVKSGKKIAKKLRQEYKKTFTGLAKDRVDRLYKTFEEHIRPKPRWIPGMVWKMVQRAVLQHYV